MKKILLTSAGNGTWSFQAEKPAHVVPVISKEYISKGVRMYDTEDGKTYVADTYDRSFTFKKWKILPEHKRF